MNSEPYLFVIVMMHLTYAAAILFQQRDAGGESRFARFFAISWVIEAIRAAILVSAVRAIAFRDTDWYCVSDLLCPIATWFLLASCASLVKRKLSWRIGAVYIVLSIPLLLFLRYEFPTVAENSFGMTTDAQYYGVLLILLVLFIPTTIARGVILYWMYRKFRETRLSGAFIATLFSAPYGIMALAIPIQFYYQYYPDWLIFFWAFRVFGFSIGLMMLQLSLRQTQLLKLNSELDQRIEQRTAELADKNEELEVFSDTISHEVRTPLYAMKMFVGALQQEDTLTPEAHHCVRNIGETIDMTETMIKDLLSYSQVSRDELTLEPVDMDTVVAMARKQLETRIQESNATIETVMDLPTVRGNETILVQILVNLISNGIKFMDKENPVIRISSEVRSDHHRVWVCDNGVGIAARHLELVFNPFLRLNDDGTSSGSGMGLAIVKRGCQRLGGDCGVESVYGEGSRFWIDCPVVTP